jgi:hypothetical protein
MDEKLYKEMKAVTAGEGVNEAGKISFELTNEGQEFYEKSIPQEAVEEYKERGNEAVNALDRTFPDGTWAYRIDGVTASRKLKMREAFNSKRTFWLVLDPQSKDSTIEDVIGNGSHDAISIGRIIIGGGNTLSAAIQRWEKEHPAIYPEENRAEAEEDAKQRIAKMQGNEGAGGVGSVGAP